jgi:outer membrane protein TolC
MRRNDELPLPVHKLEWRRQRCNPQFNRNGLIGVESVAPMILSAWRDIIASLAADTATPIFNGGRLQANVDLAPAQYRESLENYEKAMLSAYGNVVDQLAEVRYLSEQRQSLQAVADSARRAEQIANHRYDASLVSYLDVVFAEQTLLQGEQSLVQVQGQQTTATVALVRALEGGW